MAKFMEQHQDSERLQGLQLEPSDDISFNKQYKHLKKKKKRTVSLSMRPTGSASSVAFGGLNVGCFVRGLLFSTWY